MSSPPSVSHYLLVITTTSSPQQRPTGAFGSVVKDAFGLTNDQQSAFGMGAPGLRNEQPDLSFGLKSSYRVVGFSSCSNAARVRWFRVADECVWFSHAGSTSSPRASTAS
ncbi:hypothetical protein Tco_1102849 [Tanacetum coccineum]